MIWDLHIPRQDVSSALTTLAQQTGTQLLFPYEKVKSQEANPLTGRYTLGQALDILLQGTGLSGGVTGSGVITISLETSATSRDQGEVMEHKSGKASIFAGIAAFLAAAVATPGASAQEVGAGSQRSPVLEEVIVTAQKREQNLQDVALSISALSSEAIDRRGLVEMVDYLNTIPGVTMVDRGTSRRSIAIRGLAIDPTFEAGSQATVGVYFGDTPLTSLNFGINGDRGGNPVPRLVDIERIEVLRGPQGTLYGASSIAGTVRYIPKDPNLSEIEGRLASELSHTDGSGEPNTMFQGMFNVPLLRDTLAFRGVAYHFQEDGYIDDIGAKDPDLLAIAQLNDVVDQAPGHADIGATDVFGVRAGLLWQPVDSFSAKLQYTYERQRQEGLLEVQTDLPKNYQQSRFDLDSRVNGISFAPGGRGNADELNLFNLVLEYDMGFASIYSATTYGKMAATATFSARGTVAGFEALHLPWQQDMKQSGYMQELRVTTQFDTPFQAIAGLYYENTDRDFDQTVYYGGGSAAYAGLVEPIFGPNPFFPKFFGDRHDINFIQRAFFGELTYEFLDRFTATLGARRFKYHTRQSVFDAHFPFLGTPPAPPENRYAIDTGNIFKANLSYKHNDDMLAYFQWSEGFRQATPNAEADNQLVTARCDVDNDGILDGTSIPLSQLSSLESDSSENYEFGTKLSNLFDGRVQLNASVYQVDWTGLPLTLRTPCGAFFQLNSGDARSRGVEVEANLLLRDNLLLSLNGSYVDAELTEDFPEIGGEEGDPLPGSADVTFTAGLQYDFEFQGHPAYITGDVNYVSGFYNDVREIGLETGDYLIGNLRAGVTFRNNITVELFAKNINNSNALTWVESPAVNTDDRAARLRPRTFGISARYDF